MKRLVTINQAQQIDYFSIGQSLSRSLQLMEEAGLGIAQRVKDLYIDSHHLNHSLDRSLEPPPDHHLNLNQSTFGPNTYKSPILLLCGPGHNGADGLVAARYLLQWGFRVWIIFTHKVNISSHRKEWKIQYGRLLGLNLGSRKIVSPSSRAFRFKQLHLSQLLSSSSSFSSSRFSPSFSSSLRSLWSILRRSGLIIDGIWGTGGSGSTSKKTSPGLRGSHSKKLHPLESWEILVSLISSHHPFHHLLSNSSLAPVKIPSVISIDIPSGLNANTGEYSRPYGLCVRATHTLTLGLAKVGFFLMEGPSHCGHIEVLPLSFPKPIIKKIACDHFGFGLRDAASLIPYRSPTAHKGSSSEVFIIAGSQTFRGAGILAGLGAARVGAGYVSLATHPSQEPKPGDIDWLSTPEFILRSLKDFFSTSTTTATTTVTTKAISTPPTISTSSSSEVKSPVVVVGPGLGVSKETAGLIQRLKEKGEEIRKNSHYNGDLYDKRDSETENTTGPTHHEKLRVLLDADALRTLKDFNLGPVPDSWILTPHPGELAHLMGVSATEINQDRSFWVHKAASLWGGLVLLKGHHTILCHKKNRRRIIILSGNAALAKAGTGDVLSGFIGGLWAQGLTGEEAAALGAYLHGRLADEWVRGGRDVLSLLPRDLLEKIPFLLQRLRKDRSLSLGLPSNPKS